MKSKKLENNKFSVKLKPLKTEFEYTIDDTFEGLINIMSGDFRREHKKRKYTNLNSLFVGLGIAAFITLGKALFSIIKYFFTRDQIIGIDSIAYIIVSLLFFGLLKHIYNVIIKNTYIEKKE